LIVEQAPLAEPIPPRGPVAAEPPCAGRPGPGLGPTAARAVNVLFAFYIGYTLGTWINEEFDLSGKAASKGDLSRMAFEEAGVPESIADVLGGIITVGSAIGVPSFPL